MERGGFEIREQLGRVQRGLVDGVRMDQEFCFSSEMFRAGTDEMFNSFIIVETVGRLCSRIKEYEGMFLGTVFANEESVLMLVAVRVIPAYGWCWQLISFHPFCIRK
jgi:hypothetical protein